MYWKLENLLKNEIDPTYSKRARLILSTIEKNKFKKILEVGSGRGFYLYACALYPFIKNVVGVEINPSYVNRAKKTINSKKVKIFLESAYDLPFKKNEFDCVICTEVLEHLSHENRALKEMKRVLKDDGKILITVPNYNFPFTWDPLNWLLMRVFNTHIDKDIWWLAGIWADHLRLYKDKDIEKIFKNCSLTIKNKSYFVKKSLIFSHFLLYGVGKNLVEKLNLSEFDRFNYQPKKISGFLAKILLFFTKTETKNNKSVGIFYELGK